METQDFISSLKHKRNYFGISARNSKSFINFNFYQYKMAQYNRLNVKLSNSQLNKLKSAKKKKERN